MAFGGRYNYRNPRPEDCSWYDGVAYDVGIANNMLYTNSTGSKGKVTVFIRSKETGKIVQRTGICEQCGNFGYITINWKGKKLSSEDILKLKK